MDSPSSTTKFSSTLLVNFEWSKFRAVISDAVEPDKPIYMVDYNMLRSPHMSYRRVLDGNDTIIGEANVHGIKINPKLTLHGEDMSLKASSRLKTRYSYPSTAISKTGESVLLTYNSQSSFKNWDYILTNPEMATIARFSSNLWYVKKIGKIEFMDDWQQNEQVLEEIIVTSMTMYYTMLFRASNIFNLVGAGFYGRSGRNEYQEKEKQEQKVQPAVEHPPPQDMKKDITV